MASSVQKGLNSRVHLTTSAIQFRSLPVTAYLALQSSSRKFTYELIHVAADLIKAGQSSPRAEVLTNVALLPLAGH